MAQGRAVYRHRQRSGFTTSICYTVVLFLPHPNACPFTRLFSFSSALYLSVQFRRLSGIQAKPGSLLQRLSSRFLFATVDVALLSLVWESYVRHAMLSIVCRCTCTRRDGELRIGVAMLWRNALK
jgi:hypothetical protein